MLDFFIDCVPPTITAQQKGVDFKRHRFFTKAKVKEAELLFCRMLVQHRPFTPLNGPLRLHVTWTFPWRSSEPEKNRKWGWVPHDRAHPDADNANKLFVDCMAVVGFFKNDGQVADNRCMKGWGNRPGIRVKLAEWKYDPTEQ